MLKKTLALLAVISSAAIGWAVPAEAAYVVNFAQVGNNVVVTGSGSIDLTGLTFLNNSGPGDGVAVYRASDALLFVALNNDSGGYLGLTGPSSFGPSDTALFSSNDVGNTVGIQNGSNGLRVRVPVGYVSGSQLGISSSTYSNTTLSAFGFNARSYVYTTPTSDTFTINVGDVISAVPEPATWAMMMFGLGAVGATLRRRQKIATRVKFA